jgi:GTP cyclohydrolase II
MKNNFVLVYRGSLIICQRIINEFNINDIHAIVKNQNESARLAGFGMICDQIIELFVHEDEKKLSIKIIDNLGIEIHS